MPDLKCPNCPDGKMKKKKQVFQCENGCGTYVPDSIWGVTR